jgi:hypothetical protein
VLSSHSLVTCRTAFIRFMNMYVYSYHHLVLTFFLKSIKGIGGVQEQSRAFHLFDPSFHADLASCGLHKPPLDLAATRSVSHLDFPFQKCGVVEDCISDRFKALLPSTTPLDKVKMPHKRALRLVSPVNAIVFGTADQLKLTTITANGGLVRSLEQNSIFGCSVWVHGARSLIETRTSYTTKKKEDAAAAAATAAATHANATASITMLGGINNANLAQ